MTLFVSYTRKDEALVRELVDDLGRLGRAVWVDQQIHGGESWWREIIQAIQNAEVFIFALSNNSWRSKPCRRELDYAERLGIPILPVLVGPLESMFIPLAEKQMIDYCGRSADAVVRLVGALAELTARPVVLPNPLPRPPDVPFEYLYRIASVMDPNQISPDGQEELVAKLRRNLKDEEDEVARADIVKLLRELRERRELTVQNANEIDEILRGVEATQVVPALGGATRLPPADHWRRGTPGSEAPARLPVLEAPEPASPAPAEESGDGAAAEPPAEEEPERERTPQPQQVWPRPAPNPEPDGAKRAAESPGPATVAEPNAARQADAPGQTPGWLTDVIRSGGAKPKAAPAPAAAPSAAPATSHWWAEPQAGPPMPPAGYPAAPAHRAPRLAIAGALLGVLGIPLLLLGLAQDSEAGQRAVISVLLILSGLGLAVSVVAAVRREPRSPLAVLAGLAGLLGVIVYATVSGLF